VVEKVNTCKINEKNGLKNNTDTSESDVVEFDGRPFKATNFKKPTSFDVPKLAEFVNEYINKNSFCVVDGIFSDAHLQRVLSEVNSLNTDGCLKLGRLSGGRTSGQETLKVTKTEIRSDTIYWAEGTESRHPNINKVVQKMDSVICTLNNYFQGKYLINGRTKVKALRTYDTFPTFSLEKIFQPPPFEEFLEMNFQFSMVSILHR
jgi:hypothetical protein